jgi:hypothetical protein
MSSVTTGVCRGGGPPPGGVICFDCVLVASSTNASHILYWFMVFSHWQPLRLHVECNAVSQAVTAASAAADTYLDTG